MRTPQLRQPGGRSRSRRIAALLTATAVAASLLSAPAGPASAAPDLPSPTGADVPAGFLPTDAEPVAVTLITGDTVYWQDSGDGNPRVAEIEEAPRDYPVTFDQSGTQEDFYVIPTDVMEHVVAGTVDMELFNIPGLIRQGLDDAATDELPVIVTFVHDQSVPRLARDADALPATNDATAVEGINGAGVRVDRATAGTFRQAVFGDPGGDHTNRTAGAPGLDGGVDKVMLDQMLEIDLSESVPQIGAPQAWDAGFTGEGVTVAVLDTGVDASHPDLAGQVIATANFTDEADATDNHGHGTHVASTVAGTGAASDGARTGVAPGADLLIGKVCTTDGKCQTSAIMAGMEWAAEQGADVVNMSLGGEPTDGTDPTSQLLNQLSADSNVLFVTSAGNNRTRRQVGSPGAADAALAVGAVDKSDQMARFSSRGPRVGDHAVKPEITAPGVEVVAARAEGTGLGSPVDDDYTAVDGTSMAAPHVAGAAALLAQARGLTGQELKDALVSTATDGGFRWYDQGAGRVDVPTAMDSPIYATGTVNLGGVDHQAERDIVYTNRSSNDITITLQAAATDLNGGTVSGISLSTSTLTVPARGQATATVSAVLDPSNLTGQEAFGGIVTATGGGVTLRTGIGFGPPLHRVAIEVLDSNGDRIGTDTADDTFVTLTHDTLDRTVGGPTTYHLFTRNGIAVGHVPAGIYSIIATIGEHKPGAKLDLTRGSLLTEVEVDISTNTSLTLDTRDAVPVTVSVPRKADKRNHEVVVIRDLPGMEGIAFTDGITSGNFPVYAMPTPPGQLAPLRLAVSWTLAEPQPLVNLPDRSKELCLLFPRFCFSETPAYVYNLPFMYENGIPADLHENVARRDVVEIPTRFHSDHPGALITQAFAPFLPFINKFAEVTDVRISFRPGVVTEYFLADDRFSWRRFAIIQRFADGKLMEEANLHSDDWFPAAEAGARRGEERWHEAPLRVGIQEVREETLGWHVHSLQRLAAASRGGSDGDQFTAPFQVTGNSRGHGGSLSLGSPAVSWRMWNTSTGAELERSGRVFHLARGKGTYRLEQTEDLLPSQPVLTGPATTAWTFTSQPSNAQVPPRYQCPIQQQSRQDLCQIQPLILLEYALGLDIHNRMSTGRAHRFTINAGHHSKAIDRAPVIAMTVQASFDDGNTWQDARVVGKPRDTRDNGGFLPSAEPYQEFQVVLMIPPRHRTNGFVSLKVYAEDANGGTVDQSIHRAYILK